MVFNLVHFLNGLSSVAIAILSFYAYYIWFKKKAVCKLGKLIGINGIVYLIPAFLNFAWSFSLLFPQKYDFILIEGCFSVIKATIFLVIVYKLVGNKNLLYFLFLFLLSAIGISYSISAFFLFMSATSYLLILIIAADLIHFSKHYLKWGGYTVLLYTLISFLLLILVFLGREPSSMFWFIPNLIMFAVFLLFYLDIKYCGIIIKKEESKIKKISLPLFFIEFLIFIISMSAFILLSTISIHELGHALTAQYYGCERSKAVIYDLSDYPHTEMICKIYYNQTIITLAGIALTLAVGFIFLVTGSRFTTILSYLIIGFSLLIAYGDLKDLGISMNIIATVIFSSIIIIIAGIIKLSIYYIKRQGGLYKSKKELEEIQPEKYFWMDENTSIRNLYELAEALHKMDKHTFSEYVNDGKNEFSDWIKKKLGDNEFAGRLSRIKDKKEMEILILTKLLKEEAGEKNILRFICYPLLRHKIQNYNEKEA